MPSPLLSADAVSAGYGDLLAIKDVGLAVEEQSLLGVLGPNGAGKSTLLGVELQDRAPPSASSS